MSRITIILPVYNGEHYLREAIDSVLAQTYSDFELWVVNDGSTDGTVAIIDSYTDPRVRRIDNPHNMGLVATLNRSFAAVQTEYIARMDDDDLWHPDKLRLQVQYLDRHLDVGVCGTGVHKFGDLDSVMLFPADSDALKVGLLFYCMMSHPSVVYRRSMLLTTGLTYRAENFPAEDYRMWVDVLAVSKIHNIQQPLVEYRQHAEQICRQQNDVQQLKERELHSLQLHRIWPDVSAFDESFHLNHFCALAVDSDAEADRLLHWADRLCEANRHTQYVKPSVMRRELRRYVQNAIRTYYRQTWRGWWHHIVSGRWLRLDIRHNSSLIFYGNRA